MPEIKTKVSSRIYYRKLGAGPALVLLHGFPESSNLWRFVQDHLSRYFTLILPDFPGSGASTLESDTSIAQMSDCVIDIMDNERIKKAVIAGHSMGGYVGFDLAARHPDRVAGLSLVHSTPAADDEEKKKTRLKTIDLIEKGGKSAFLRQMIPNLFSEAFKQKDAATVEEQVQSGMQLGEKSLINYYRAMAGRSDRTGLLQAATHPIQWISGIDDNIISYKKILALCAKSGISFVTFYNNCGHMSMIEAPERLISDLKQFADYCYKLPASSI